MDVPETLYARSGDGNIASQVVGEGDFDLVYIPGWVPNIAAVGHGNINGDRPFAVSRSSAASAIVCSGTARMLASVFGHFDPAIPACAPNIDDAGGAVDVPLLERDPLSRA